MRHSTSGAQFAELLVASGERIRASEHGRVYHNTGEIWFDKAPEIGIDANLFGVLKASADVLKLVLRASSIDTGQHVPHSRHYDGRAVDIGSVYGVGLAQRPATLINGDAMRLVRFLLAHGFVIGEGRPLPGLLFGPVHTAYNPTAIGHGHHLHVSLPRAPGSAGEENPPEPLEDA